MMELAITANSSTWSNDNGAAEFYLDLCNKFQYISESCDPTTYEPRKTMSDTTLSLRTNQGPVIQFLALEKRQLLEDSHPRTVRALEHIRRLRPNWDSYGAHSPSNETVDHAYLLIDQLERAARDLGSTLPEPEIAPGAKGTIQFEWVVDGKSFELEFYIVDHQHKYFSLICPSEDDSTWEEDSFTRDALRHPHVRSFLTWI